MRPEPAPPPPGQPCPFSTFTAPAMPEIALYALLPRLTMPGKPFVFPTLRALAKRILRDKGPEALELRAERIVYAGEIREVIDVLADDQAAGRRRRIGYAWIGGRPVESLRAALEAELPAAVFDPLRAARAL